MRVVRAISPDEVTATFLRGGLESPRFRERLVGLLEEDGVDASVIAEPDLADADANAYRLGLFGRYHEWLAGPHVYGEFPGSLDWRRVFLTREEVLSILYIDWDWWLEISGGTRLPLDAARRIRAGEIPGSTVEEHEPIAARLTSPDPPPELIVVAAPDLRRLVVIEGHVRLTSYALFPERLPDELEVLLGVAELVEGWTLF